MLELLTYEPYGEPLPKEKQYIKAILDGNNNPPQAAFHRLFSDFYNCCQQGNYTNIGWLAQWKAAYGRKHLPLFFKKICFYLMVKGDWAESDFMAQIGLKVSRIRKWNISPQFRKYAERDTYSAIRVFRNGVKKQYIVSAVKKLYYEAGRQVQESTSKAPKQSMTLSKLPPFVDVFAGTASVAASVVSDGCPPPIVNDYDPIMMCFVWAFTHRQKMLCKIIAEYHSKLMKQDIRSEGMRYGVEQYESDFNYNPKNLRTSPKAWDNPDTRSVYKEFYGYTDDRIEEEKALAQCHQDFIIRVRNSYIDETKVLESCDREALRKIFNAPSRSTAQRNSIIQYAFAEFYCYSFPGGGMNGAIRNASIVDATSYYSYLSNLQPSLSAKRKNDPAINAQTLTGTSLDASSITLESTEEPAVSFSRRLKKAVFHCKDFKEILQNCPPNGIYYLDSPYFLTMGYDEGFSDDDHKDMLELLRDAKFMWIFSMQYNASNRCRRTNSSDKTKRSQHIIKDYSSYYRGFYVPFQLDARQRWYIPVDASAEIPSNLFVVLFDVEACMKKWDNTNVETAEMLVVNFDCLRTIPLNDTAVVLPFDLFLECADAGDKYSDIVKKAIAWRKGIVSEPYTDEHPV